MTYPLRNHIRDHLILGVSSSGSSGPQTVSRTAVNVASYQTTSSDYLLGVTRTATGACAIEIQTSDIQEGRKLVIVDEGGLAGTNNITITCQGGETISGQSSLVIDGNYNTVVLYSDGSNMFVGG